MTTLTNKNYFVICSFDDIISFNMCPILRIIKGRTCSFVFLLNNGFGFYVRIVKFAFARDKMIEYRCPTHEIK